MFSTQSISVNSFARASGAELAEGMVLGSCPEMDPRDYFPLTKEEANTLWIERISTEVGIALGRFIHNLRITILEPSEVGLMINTAVQTRKTIRGSEARCLLDKVVTFLGVAKKNGQHVAIKLHLF